MSEVRYGDWKKDKKTVLKVYKDVCRNVEEKKGVKRSPSGWQKTFSLVKKKYGENTAMMSRSGSEGDTLEKTKKPTFYMEIYDL